MSDLEAKVRELAKLSILTNRISEVHKKNLEAYPFIFFEGVVSASIDYDLEREGKNHISMDLTLKPNSANPSLEKRFEVLDKSIKNLFWKEVSVSVTIDGKELYNSTPKAEK